MIRTNWLVAVLLIVAVGCSKSGSNAAPDADAGATASGAQAGAEVDAGAAPEPPSAAGTFKGKYEAKPATLYIPAEKDYANVKQAKSDDSTFVGEGTLTIEVAADGRVTGTIDSGPASPAVIDGTKSGDEIRGTVRRKNPEDLGLTGVLVGTLEGGKLTGTLTLAEATAAILRDAPFTATK